MAEFQIWLADMNSSTERFLGSTSDATTLTYTIPNVARSVSVIDPRSTKKGGQRRVGRIFSVGCMEVCKWPIAGPELVGPEWIF